MDSTTKLDFSEEEFWEFRVQEWYHRADFESNNEFVDDRLMECHPFFQIAAFVELTVIVVHLTY